MQGAVGLSWIDLQLSQERSGFQAACSLKGFLASSLGGNGPLDVNHICSGVERHLTK